MERRPEGDGQPISGRSRILTIDVLRGVAILGILLMNVQSFAMPDIAYMNPYVWGDMTGANRLVHHLTHVFGFGKFISIFAILFGAGIALQERRGQRASTHYRRMAVLLVIGLLHAYILWHGDILFSYALIGSVVFLMRRLSPRALLWTGAGFYVCGLLINAFLAGTVLLAMNFAEPTTVDEIRSGFAPSPEVLQEEVRAFRGSWLEQMPTRATISLYVQTFLLLIYSLPYIGGLMLLGMALTKLAFFERWPRERWAKVALAGCLIGWALAASQLWLDARSGHDPILTVLVWPLLNAVAMPLVAVGYSAAVCWIVAGVSNGNVLWPLAAVGRTALSCYLLETLIGTTLFYGHGLGWYGKVDRVGQIGVVLAVWALLLILAPLWLRRFQQGPMEWAWRRLTYGDAERRTPNAE